MIRTNIRIRISNYMQLLTATSTSTISNSLLDPSRREPGSEPETKGGAWDGGTAPGKAWICMERP